jgi:hypothetical protein
MDPLARGHEGPQFTQCHTQDEAWNGESGRPVEDSPERFAKPIPHSQHDGLSYRTVAVRSAHASHARQRPTRTSPAAFSLVSSAHPSGMDQLSVLHSLPMTPSPVSQEGKLSYNRLLLLVLPLCLAGIACSTTPPSGTILFEDARGSVSLQTISDPSVQASHPVKLEPALLAHLLTGLTIQDDRMGPHRYVAGFAAQLSAYPLFSEDQIHFLAPLLADGLRKATFNECIEYRVVTTHGGSNRFESPTTEITAGSLYAHGRLLYVILSQYRYNPMRTNLNKADISYRQQEPFDYSGLRYRALRFTPKAALQADTPTPPTLEKSTDRFVAVDYQLLDQATRAAEAQVRSREALPQEVEALKQELESIKRQLGSQNPRHDSSKEKTAPPLNQ